MKQVIPLIILVLFLLLMICATGHAVGPFRSEVKITSDWHSETGKGGERRNNIHKGVDLVPLSLDYKIYPVMSGVVSDIGVSLVYGKYVIVDHGDNLYSRYGHAEKIFYTALVGSFVDHDTPIMLMGSTGYSDGMHLHFEVYRIINGVEVYLNPLMFFGGREQ